MRFILIALLLGLPASALALVYQGEQTLYEDTLWQGEVLIDGILTVAPHVRLEIRPGTRVSFTRIDSDGDGIGESELYIQGIFSARGTLDAPIVFGSAARNPAPGDWGAINMMASTEDGLMEHCIVEYGYRGFHAHFAGATIRSSLFRRNYQALQFQDSRLRLEELEIRDNHNALQFRDSEVSISGALIQDNLWAVRALYSSLEMENVLLAGNRFNGLNLRESFLLARNSRIENNRRGLYLQQSEAEIKGTLIRGNLEHGILLENSIIFSELSSISDNGRSGVKWIDSHGSFRQSVFEDNGEYALFNDGPTKADVRNNWWGTTVPERIDAMILDAADRPGRAGVDYSSFLLEPPFSNTMTQTETELP